MLDEHVELLEAAFVKKHLDPFSCRELALGVLRIYALLSSAHACGSATLDKFLDLFVLNTHINIFFILGKVSIFLMCASKTLPQIALLRRNCSPCGENSEIRGGI